MTNDEIIEHLYKKNGDSYNLHKASEELQELSLVLTQRLTKPTKVKDQDIIDEIGDVKIRLAILEKMFDKDLIQERITRKLSKFQSYIDSETYKKI